MKHTLPDFMAHEIVMEVRNWPDLILMGHENVFMATKSQKYEAQNLIGHIDQ